MRNRWRHIVVCNVRYRWRGSSYVIVQDEDGKRVCAGSAAEIKGIDWYTWERSQWKGGPEGMMRPSDVANFIRGKPERMNEDDSQ